MTRAVRSICAAALALCLLAPAAPALALGAIDMTTPGSITLSAADTQDGYREDLAQATMDVTVYRVATVNEYGAFTLTDDFLPLMDTQAAAAAWNGGILNSESQVKTLQAAALALVQPAAPGEEGAESAEPPAESALPAGKTYTAVAAVEGVIALEDDPETDAREDKGLFLVIPAQVETALWRYTFQEALLAVPSIQRGGQDGGQGEDQWVYDVPVTLKAQRERRLTELVIDKSLSGYNATLGPATFLFEVTAQIDGKVVYDNVAGLTFDGSGSRSVTVSGIPVGAQVTVTEVYSGGSYTPSGGNRVELGSLPPAETDGPSHAAFANDYDGRRVPDRSVINTFQFNGTGWQWQSSEEAGQ